MDSSGLPRPLYEYLDNYITPQLSPPRPASTAAADMPCAACSGTSRRQRRCPYHSKVELSHSSDDQVTWSVGTKATLEDRPANPRCVEAQNMRFVQANTTIPVPTVLAQWKDGGRYFVLAQKIAGQPLDVAWPNLSTADKSRIAEQTALYLSQLRELQSARMQSVDGAPLHLSRLFGDEAAGPHGPISTIEVLWAEMSGELQGASWESICDVLDEMPPATPYTFTHGDLSPANILVENGNLAGIIGWEDSGYLPVWWEYVQTRLTSGPEDREWKALLRKYMPDFSGALSFCRSFHQLQTLADNDDGRSGAYASFWTDD